MLPFIIGGLVLASAAYKLGQYFDAKEKEEAIEWLKKAAEQGYAKAQFWLGFCYEHGLDGQESDSSSYNRTSGNSYDAHKWYQKAVEQYCDAAQRGNIWAQYNLGVCYERGYGVQRNVQQAERRYREAAQKGHIRACYNLGEVLASDSNDATVGSQKIMEEAVMWYRRGAEQGDAEAQVRLGERYFYGEGNKAAAKEWFRKSAAQGNGEAMKFLEGEEQYKADTEGKYNLGHNVWMNRDEIYGWLRKCHTQGYSGEQLFPRNSYENDASEKKEIGVQQNAAAGAVTEHQAAEQGGTPAQYGVYQKYNPAVQKLLPVAKSHDREKDAAAVAAFIRYCKAAEQGDAQAQYNLGVCYEKGIGVTKNPEEARKWFREAAEQGYKLAVEKLPSFQCR